jgi:ADP-ribosyl-[dinitrogen reductase] hydrolase
LALALADSIAIAGWDLNDQARRYVAWWLHGHYSVNGRCFDIGITTNRALSNFRKLGDARKSGISDETASGNGSIMRLAPVPIRYVQLFPNEMEKLTRLAIESSLTTHASESCKSACAYLGLLLAALIRGVPREEILSSDWDHFQRLRRAIPVHQEVANIAAGSYRNKRPPEIKGTGYVIDSLEAALWAFYTARSFREAVLSGAIRGQPRPRRRHYRRRLRPTRRGLLGGVLHSPRMAGRPGTP